MKAIFSKYIISGSPNDIKCDDDLQQDIYKQLDPPYEELFDLAEEHALKILAEPWKAIGTEESVDYQEVIL